MPAILDNTRRGGAGRAVVDKKATWGEEAGGREGTPTGRTFIHFFIGWTSVANLDIKISMFYIDKIKKYCLC